MSALEHATWAYNIADKLAGEDWPYIFGGGHGVAPVDGVIPPTRGVYTSGPVGYDCSGWCSAILWHAGVLEHQRALSTLEFESWGKPGEGQYLTLWVLDEAQAGGIHHCFLELKVPLKPHRWSAAAHSGTICGWQDMWDTWITKGYTPRQPS